MANGKLIIPAVTVDPVQSLTGTVLYAKNVTGTKQLFARASDGSSYQLTPPGLGVVPLPYDTIINYTFPGPTGAISNNVNFGILGQNTLIVCDASAQYTGYATGFSGGVDGITVTLYRNDTSSQTFNIPNNNGGSSVGNRLLNTGNLQTQWEAQGVCSWIYIASLSAWVQTVTDV